MFARLVTGAVAGAVGTAAMTVFMNPVLGQRLPRRWRPDEFVPRQVVQWAEDLLGRPDALGERAEGVAATIAHFGYGATMGAAYGMIAGPGWRRNAAARGAAWGLLVWAAGYQGWLPAVGVRPPTTHQPTTKWPVPIGNHVLYGAVTAMAYDDLWVRRWRRGAVVVRV